METEREQSVRLKAYEIWQSEGQPENRAEDHWQQAEQQMHGNDSGQETPAPDQAQTNAATRSGKTRKSSVAGQRA